MKIGNISIFLFIVMFFIHSNSYSQYNRHLPKKKIGGSVLYNMHTASLGFGLRYEVPLNQIDFLEGIRLVPQASYFPGFNNISEFYIGSGVHVHAYKYNTWSFYGLLNLSYNGWINHEDILYREAGFSNLGIEPGAGASCKVLKCLHPFVELRLNLRWFEPHMQFGIMYDIKCDRRGAVPCSNIPPQPVF